MTFDVFPMTLSSNHKGFCERKSAEALRRVRTTAAMDGVFRSLGGGLTIKAYTGGSVFENPMWCSTGVPNGGANSEHRKSFSKLVPSGGTVERDMFMYRPVNEQYIPRAGLRFGTGMVPEPGTSNFQSESGNATASDVRQAHPRRLCRLCLSRVVAFGRRWGQIEPGAVKSK